MSKVCKTTPHGVSTIEHTPQTCPDVIIRVSPLSQKKKPCYTCINKIFNALLIFFMILIMYIVLGYIGKLLIFSLGGNIMWIPYDLMHLGAFVMITTIILFSYHIIKYCKKN